MFVLWKHNRAHLMTSQHANFNTQLIISVTMFSSNCRLLMEERNKQSRIWNAEQLYFRGDRIVNLNTSQRARSLFSASILINKKLRENFYSFLSFFLSQLQTFHSANGTINRRKKRKSHFIFKRDYCRHVTAKIRERNIFLRCVPFRLSSFCVGPQSC